MKLIHTGIKLNESSDLPATSSSFSIFLIWFLPNERILSLDIPVRGMILSMQLVESASLSQFLRVLREASIFMIGGCWQYNFTYSASSAGMLFAISQFFNAWAQVVIEFRIDVSETRSIGES